jgi:hypothetical protein
MTIANTGNQLQSQNSAILEYLKAGHTLTSLEAWARFGCSALHSRCSDLRNKMHEPIGDRWVTIKGMDASGNPVSKRVKSYFYQREQLAKEGDK